MSAARRLVPVVVALLACVQAADGRAQDGAGSWAATEIQAVTQSGVLGSSPATFRPKAPLTQRALADAVRTLDAVQNPTAPPAPTPPPKVTSTVGLQASVAGVVTWQVDAPGKSVAQADLAVDGATVASLQTPPFAFPLDTRSLPDGSHTLAANLAFQDGGYTIAVWTITVANAPGAWLTPDGPPTPVPVAKYALPAQARPPTGRRLYTAVVPTRPVTIRRLDAALVGYLGLGDAARAIQAALRDAGLRPPAGTGSEAVARLLGLRLDHPAAQDYLELLPSQPATRAEAAYLFAKLLALDPGRLDAVRAAVAGFVPDALTPWQQRILTTAVSYVGFPYVWGGTSPGPETDFGVTAPGGFDCSGFVWRVYKLTAYADEGSLAATLRGRTTYQMSGEVPRRERIAFTALEPGDVLFFGARGTHSSPKQVDHTGIYLGGGWFVQSSGVGVTVLPLDGWYRQTFAWARRPLREAGLE